ncbi:hypothetical protein [Paenibacillus donghaensis]|uniref:Uncharacterized protein n=1 Tax=Paenibacillus donghaensis TaxID=414771 RepID=A0A2Z2KS62_9BACL|nr:hypothetical protein [Paenibacillus donghaensis]ASA21938.1 hypothetical protein B9T62_14830 [Paenibacillus donghaensis]
MSILSEVLISGSVPNKIVINKEDGIPYVIFAVHHQGEVIMMGPLLGRENKDWFNSCWLISKNDLLERYYLPYTE